MDLKEKFRKVWKKNKDKKELFIKELELFFKNKVLNNEEYLIIKRLLCAERTPVGEIIVPRVDMVCIKEDASLKDAIELYKKEGFSKIPVIRERKDEIIGILHIKEIIKTDNFALKVKDIAQEPVFIPEYKKVLDTLWFMQKERLSIAIVVDEFGSVIGLVTMEDLLEEIVGELVDEFDKEEALFRKLDNGSFLFSARIELDEVSKLLGVSLEAPDVHTLGGYIVSTLKRVPEQGEKFQLKNVEFKITEGTPQRIKIIRAKKTL